MPPRPLALAALLAALAAPAYAQTGPSYPRFNDGVAAAPAVAIENAPFDVARFFDAPPRDENAAPLYLAALAEFNSGMTPCLDPLDSPVHKAHDARIRARNGRLYPLLNRWLADPQSVTGPEIDGLLAEYAEGFRLLREAQLRDRCVFQTGVGLMALVPHTQAAIQVEEVTKLKVRRELDRGEVDEAIADVAVFLRFTRDIQPRGYLITQLVAGEMSRVAARDMIAPILVAPGLTPAQGSILLSTLLVHESRSIDAYTEALKMEYISARVNLDDLAHHQDRLAARIGATPGASVVRSLFAFFDKGPAAGAGPPPAAVPGDTLFDGMRLGDYGVSFGHHADAPPRERLPDDVDAAVREAARPELDLVVHRLNALYRPLLDLKGRPREEQIAAAIRDLPKAFAGNDSLTVLVRELQPDLTALAPNLGRGEACLRGAMALTALRRWQLTHDGASPTPAQFAAACRAAGLEAVPLDPFNGQPLQYALSDGEPTISSSGKDAHGTPLSYRLPKPAP